METFAINEVTHAIEDALKLGTISFDAVRHLLLCRIERRPPRLDMENYPHLPMAQVTLQTKPRLRRGMILYISLLQTPASFIQQYPVPALGHFC